MVRPGNTRYESNVARSGGDAPKGRSPSALESKPDEAPPSSSSGVRAKHGASLRRNTPPFRPLTPYQARLDVEMDDTAVSKVRDPSVSISLGAELGETELSPKRRKKAGLAEAAISVAAGVVLGALLVVLAVLALRALGS